MLLYSKHSNVAVVLNVVYALNTYIVMYITVGLL